MGEWHSDDAEKRLQSVGAFGRDVKMRWSAAGREEEERLRTEFNGYGEVW